MNLRTIIIAASAIMLASCCSCRKGKSVILQPLTTTQWNLIEFYGKPFKANDNFYIILDGKDKRFNGRGDCNSIMGAYKLEANGEIDFDSMASTRAMCPNQTEEDRFMRMLEDVDNYKMEGNLLMLFNDDSELTAIFEAK